MRRKLFEKFYSDTIEKIATQVVAHNKGFSYKSNLDGVYEEYLNQKTALRYLVKSHSITSKDKNALLLDGHKVAACITCALVKVRVIANEHVDDTEDEGYALDKSNRLNEQVALLSGLSCLLAYMIEDKVSLTVNETTPNKIELIFPDTKYQDRSAYLDSLVRGLYYSNLLSNINPLLLSHIFFMIEMYHRKCIELEKVKQNTAITNER